MVALSNKKYDTKARALGVDEASKPNASNMHPWRYQVWEALRYLAWAVMEMKKQQGRGVALEEELERSAVIHAKPEKRLQGQGTGGVKALSLDASFFSTTNNKRTAFSAREQGYLQATKTIDLLNTENDR